MTPTGRRLYGDKGKEYALTNYLIQSHAAEILKQGICDLHSVGLGEYLILPVHDELVLDVPREEADEVKNVLEKTLNEVGSQYFVPLTWSADVMEHRWGDKYREAVAA
jgi:DNA polymerase-1